MEATDRAVERLTEAHTETTEAGPVDWPPLLVWLEESVTMVMGRTGAGNGAGIPLNTEALELLTYIDRRITLMREALGGPPAPERTAEVSRLWELAKTERQGGRLDDIAWERISDEFQDWVLRIEAEEDRPGKWELTVACPRCEKRWVTEDGERRAAVVIMFKPGQAPVAECRNDECGMLWAGWADVARLGFTVGARQDIAVLEACGIDTEGMFAIS